MPPSGAGCLLLSGAEDFEPLNPGALVHVGLFAPAASPLQVSPSEAVGQRRAVVPIPGHPGAGGDGAARPGP